ncbi:hypothetical protein U1Q18_004870 [Sarracenia purpurea var. burkii]
MLSNWLEIDDLSRGDQERKKLTLSVDDLEFSEFLNQFDFGLLVEIDDLARGDRERRKLTFANIQRSPSPFNESHYLSPKYHLFPPLLNLDFKFSTSPSPLSSSPIKKTRINLNFERQISLLFRFLSLLLKKTLRR